jgi:hypothetical protein
MPTAEDGAEAGGAAKGAVAGEEDEGAAAQ